MIVKIMKVIKIDDAKNGKRCDKISKIWLKKKQKTLVFYKTGGKKITISQTQIENFP